MRTSIVIDDLPKNSNLITGTYVEQEEEEIHDFRFSFYRSTGDIKWKDDAKPSSSVTKEEILKNL